MAKLHVPPPEGADDRSDVNLGMLATILLTALAAIGMVRVAQDHVEATAVPVPKEVHRDAYDDLADQRELAQKVGRLDAAALASKEWTEPEQAAVMRFGPRAAAEAICTKFADDIRNDKLTKTLRIEIEKSIDRRVEFAPWTCMLRLHLERAIPEGSLRNEMDEWFVEISEHRGNERIPISVLEEFRARRERPQNPSFYAWLRLCALDFDYAVHAECQKLLHQMSPEQGADLLMMIEKHWAEIGTTLPDMRVIIAGLGYLARNGQPHSWKVAETTELPDYDVDFRQAAVGYLCRMMNTPTPKEREGIVSELDLVPQLAGDQLRKIGLVGARAYEEKLLRRWRETCRIAFGGGANEDRTKMVNVPLLAVWDGDPAKPANFSIHAAADLGTCKLREGYPPWYCLAQTWVDESRTLDAAVAHAFTKTRYMEWEEDTIPE